MPRNRAPSLTEEEKFNLQEHQEHELGRLQNQYNVLQKDRRRYTHGEISRLNNLLRIYLKEHAGITLDLEVATSPDTIRQANKIADDLGKVLDHYVLYNEEVKKERQWIDEIAGQIKKEEKERNKWRSMQITDRQYEERVQAAFLTCEALMCKLDVQNKKFGTICAQNRAIKHEISRLLWEREIFMKIWNRLIHKLVLGKKFMMDLIEQATIAYDQREQWCSKLQALRFKAHSDFVLHVQEMRQLKRRADNHEKLEDFFNRKGQKRVMRDLMEKHRVKKLEMKSQMEEKLKTYQQYVDEIFEFTKEKQVYEIVRKYHKKEVANFALFNYVIAAIQELEMLAAKCGDLQEEITTKEFVKEKQKAKQKEEIEDVEKLEETARSKVESAEDELEETNNYIKQMLTATETLFRICRCDRDPIVKLLGDNTKVTKYNFTFHFKLIESAIINAMLAIYKEEKNLYEKKKMTFNERIVWDDSRRGELQPFDHEIETTPCPLCVTYELVSDVIDTQQQVMTRRQVKQSLRTRLLQPEVADQLHNVSKCFLPGAREIIQKRFQ